MLFRRRVPGKQYPTLSDLKDVRTIDFYADDCHLHLAYEPDLIEMIIGHINADLYHVSTWLNISKCSPAYCSAEFFSESGVAVVLDDEILLRVDTLGVVFDRALLFSMTFLKSPSRSCQSCTHVYMLMGTALGEEDIVRIKKLQNSVIRFIFNLRRVYTVILFILLLTCCMVHKVLKFREPQYLSKKLYQGRFLNEVPAKMGGFTF
ncbi:hypothetical protein J6590_070649 [Homalodisca vitripennis]|nr:hypothetical protein J6590_070649 [Homalodisca vitripennis]